MDIASKEFPGKLIAYCVAAGAVVIFCYEILDGLDLALEGYDLYYKYLDRLYYWWYGG